MSNGEGNKGRCIHEPIPLQYCRGNRLTAAWVPRPPGPHAVSASPSRRLVGIHAPQRPHDYCNALRLMAFEVMTPLLINMIVSGVVFRSLKHS